MIKIVRSVTSDGSEPLASFELVDGKVVETYVSDNFQREMETLGIYILGKTYHPSDGQPFMDALDKYYSRSSHIQVESS